ncbi:GNAT family N-acetyltransferase [Oceanobacter kriegii]|uniref:GNAT family N-acetyltransferase n=1 Tax=Oceanobacter kriegii TaxID=64972 RepID=UPI000419B4AC|nr:GNAT family protein [Oceanobacter kriegii]
MNWNFETDNFLIRLPITDQDEESLYGLLQNPTVGAHLPKSKLYANVQVLDELRRATMTFQAREAATWVVERLTGTLEERAKLAARVVIKDINWMQASARLQWELDDSVNAEQLAEFIGAIEQFCFSELELHRIELRMLPSATKHTELAEALGYQREGVLPAQLEFEGNWIDQVLYSRLSSD